MNLVLSMLSCFMPASEERQNMELVGRGYIIHEANMYTLKNQASSPACDIAARDMLEDWG